MENYNISFIDTGGVGELTVSGLRYDQIIIADFRIDPTQHGCNLISDSTSNTSYTGTPRGRITLFDQEGWLKSEEHLKISSKLVGQVFNLCDIIKIIPLEELNKFYTTREVYDE